MMKVKRKMTQGPIVNLMPQASIVSSGNRKGMKWIYAENDAEGGNDERKHRAREVSIKLFISCVQNQLYLFISVFQPCPHVKA